jgi:hypothetical protein
MNHYQAMAWAHYLPHSAAVASSVSWDFGDPAAYQQDTVLLFEEEVLAIQVLSYGIL